MKSCPHCGEPLEPEKLRETVLEFDEWVGRLTKDETRAIMEVAAQANCGLSSMMVSAGGETVVEVPPKRPHWWQLWRWYWWVRRGRHWTPLPTGTWRSVNGPKEEQG